MDYFSARRAALLGHARADGVDGYLLSHPASVTYLAGAAGEGARLLVTPKSVVLIAASARLDRSDPAGKGYEVRALDRDDAVDQEAAAASDRAGVKVIGVEADHLPVGAMGRLESHLRRGRLRPLAGRVEALRAVKDQSEVEAIRSAVRATERALTMLRSLLREQDSEKELADALDGYVRRAGGRGSAFPTVVSLGDAGAYPHRPSPDRVLSGVSKVLVGCGADVGYRCELWQAFRSPFPATPTRKTHRERAGHNFEAVSRAVRQAFDAAVAALRPGEAARDAAGAARRVLSDAGFGDYTPWVLGQGVGIEARELPVLHPEADSEVRPGLVLTVTPAVLIPEWGGVRFGGPVLVTREGGVPLFAVTSDV